MGECSTHIWFGNSEGKKLYWEIQLFAFFWDVTQRWLVVTDISGQPVGPILKGSWTALPLVTDYQSALCNILEERRFHSHRGGSLESRMFEKTTRPGVKNKLGNALGH
jgi:hypothetical protein